MIMPFLKAVLPAAPPPSHDASVARAPLLILAVCALALAVSAVIFHRNGIRFDQNGGMLLAAIPLAACLLLPALTRRSGFRFGPRLLTLIMMAGGALVVLQAFLPLSYAAIILGKGLPLADPWLAALDEALGYNAPAVISYADSHPDIARIANQVYLSIKIQVTVLTLGLILYGRSSEALNSVLALTVSLMACMALVAVFPALGTYTHYGIAPDMHPNIGIQVTANEAREIQALRAGTLTEFRVEHALGIVTFPSFHAIVAVLLAWTGWSLPWLRWGFLAVNAAMLAATPLHGSHYLVDVIAGSVIGLASIRAALVIRARLSGAAQGGTEAYVPMSNARQVA